MSRKEIKIYGMTVKRFIEVMEGPSLMCEEAAVVLDRFKACYPYVVEYMEKLEKQYIKKGGE